MQSYHLSQEQECEFMRLNRLSIAALSELSILKDTEESKEEQANDRKNEYDLH